MQIKKERGENLRPEEAVDRSLHNLESKQPCQQPREDGLPRRARLILNDRRKLHLLYDADRVGHADTIDHQSVVNALYLDSKAFFFNCDGIHRKSHKRRLCANFFDDDGRVHDLHLWRLNDARVFGDGSLQVPVRGAGGEGQDADGGDKDQHLDDVAVRAFKRMQAVSGNREPCHHRGQIGAGKSTQGRETHPHTLGNKDSCPSGLQGVPLDDVDGIVVDDLLDVALKGGEEEAHLDPCEHGEGKQGNNKPLKKLRDELALVHLVTLSKNL